MYQHSAVNQNISLRREARRRKILENSTNRLKLIEGINSSSGGNSPERYSGPEIQNFKSYVQPELINHQINSLDLDSKFQDFVKESKELKEVSDYFLEEKEDVENDVEELVREIESKKNLPVVGFVIEKRLHYVLLALIVNALFFFNAGYFFYENIFCPFFTLKIAELFGRRGGQEQNLVIFLLVAGLPTQVQKYATVILSVIPALISDLFLYIFVFVIGTKIWNIET